MLETKPTNLHRKMLGERLADRGLLTERQIDMAMHEQKRTGAMLGEILTQLGFVTPQGLSLALAEQGGVQFVELNEWAITMDVLALVPEAMARRLNVLPLERDGRVLTLAMANIYDIAALTEVENHARLRVKVVGAPEEAIQTKINEAYGERKSIEDLIEEAIQSALRDRAGAELQLPIVQLVDQLLHKALRDRATDLHVQPSERTVLTRYRVDGNLVQGVCLPKVLQAAVLARLKIMAEVNIAESRLPQDGKFRIQMGRSEFDVRASFMPCIHGEKAVLRLLDRSKLIMGLEQLGMPTLVYTRFSSILERPHGVLLVTGPTGSGKTTTLYSALNSINTADRCIVTVEDPVEYELPLITQVQVNVKSGLTFSTGLRSILRQDPDIILIGEIRDNKTAGIAIRAAMTGHFVLSTLHTNDPVGAIPRLQDMGISRLELATVLQGIHAQRLVRVNCRACVKPYEPGPEAVTMLKPHQCHGLWQRGEGCVQCGFTGVKGRRAIHDLLYISAAVRELIASNASLAEIEMVARQEGKSCLFEHALLLAQEGIIALEEAVRVTMVDEQG